jgi:hypothetical protein
MKIDATQKDFGVEAEPIAAQWRRLSVLRAAFLSDEKALS